MVEIIGNGRRSFCKHAPDMLLVFLVQYILHKGCINAILIQMQSFDIRSKWLVLQLRCAICEPAVHDATKHRGSYRASYVPEQLRACGNLTQPLPAKCTLYR